MTYARRRASAAAGGQLLKDDFANFENDIKDLFRPSSSPQIRDMCGYYFDGQGKSFRPTIIFTMARCCNIIHGGVSEVSRNQRKVAMIAEMIHVGSFIHDDVVDFSDYRRGKESVNYLCGDRNAVMIGNYMVATASRLLATIGNDDVTAMISEIIEELVAGELMQATQQDNSPEGRFQHYIQKTYKKTAALIANSCKAVAYLSECDRSVQEAAYEYGKNLGLAFQVVDDILDFKASSAALGKPAAADIRLGLATPPVLYASEHYPELNPMIERRFGKPGDVETTLDRVMRGDSLERAASLAESYCSTAMSQLDSFPDCSEKRTLLELGTKVLERSK